MGEEVRGLRFTNAGGYRIAAATLANGTFALHIDRILSLFYDPLHSRQAQIFSLSGGDPNKKLLLLREGRGWRDMGGTIEPAFRIVAEQNSVQGRSPTIAITSTETLPEELPAAVASPAFAPTATLSRESPNLDFLRATAVLCVFYGHLAGLVGLYTPRNLGFFGVVLFFIHTSCVLMGSLERLETGGFPRTWPLAAAFAVRRLFRIYPLSIVCVLLVPLFGVPKFPGDAYVWVGWPAYLSNLAITQNLTHSRVVLAPLWTLPVEVQMYGALPFLYLGVRKGRYRSFLFWVFSAVASLAIPLVFQGRLNVLLYGPCFVAGIVAYDLSQVLRPRIPAWLWPVTLALAVGIWKVFDGNPSFLAEIHRAWIFALVLGVLIFQFHEITFAPVARVAHLVAKYSYGIYVSHVAVFWFAVSRMAHFPAGLRLLVGALLSVLAPVALYHLVEHPCIRLGSRYARRFRRA